MALTLDHHEQLLQVLTNSWTNYATVVVVWVWGKKRRVASHILLLIYGYIKVMVYIPEFNLVLGLQNKLSTIHPLLILYFYSFTVGHYLSQKKQFFFEIVRELHKVLLIIVFGGWWAFQEFTWGGWWNWDSVEAPVYLTTIGIALSVHNYSTRYRIATCAVRGVCAVLTSMVLARVSSGSVHAFIPTADVHNYYLFCWVNTKTHLLFCYSQIHPNHIFILKYFSYVATYLLLKLLTKTSLHTHFWYIVVMIVGGVSNYNYCELTYITNVLDLYETVITCSPYRSTWSKPITSTLAGTYTHLNHVTN